MSEQDTMQTQEDVVEYAKKSMLVRFKEGLTYKNGKFSKTAFFTSSANFLVLMSYVLSWGAGATFTMGEAFSFTVPSFDTSAAIGLLTVINGTYLGNNFLKNQANGNGH